MSFHQHLAYLNDLDLYLQCPVSVSDLFPGYPGTHIGSSSETIRKHKWYGKVGFRLMKLHVGLIALVSLVEQQLRLLIS